MGNGTEGDFMKSSSYSVNCSKMNELSSALCQGDKLSLNLGGGDVWAIEMGLSSGEDNLGN